MNKYQKIIHKTAKNMAAGNMQYYKGYRLSVRGIAESEGLEALIHFKDFVKDHKEAFRKDTERRARNEQKAENNM